MEVHIHRHILLLFFVIFSCSLFSSQAFKFYVGGKDGWVLNPSENYTHWTERNRFQVNDTLVFKYKKGSDSVLVVNKDDYYNCNTKNPIKKLEEGDSEYKVEKSGPFFFISGKKQNCEKGQKLLVVVLSVKHNNTIKHHPPISSPTQAPSKTPVSAPTPSSSSPSPASYSPGPAASTPETSTSPSPSPSYISLAPAPILAPGPVSLAPTSYSPGPAPESSISPPASSPSPGSSSISSPPASSPGSEPEASPSPSLSPSNSPFSSPPAPPSESPVNSPSNSPSSSSPPPPSPSPSTSTKSAAPGNQNVAPTPASSAWAVTPSYVLLGSVTLLLSGAF